MNESLIRVLLEFVRAGELSRSQVKKITDEANEVLKFLENLGWIGRTNGKFKLRADLETIAKELSRRIEGNKMNIPFSCTVYSSKNAYLIAIPGYVVRSLGIEPGDLVVVSIDGVRLSGSVVGKKRLLYIQKRYWDRIGIQNKKEVDVVLEALYKGRSRYAGATEETVSEK